MTKVKVKLGSGRIIWGDVRLQQQGPDGGENKFVNVWMEIEETLFSIVWSRSSVERAIKENGTLIA